MKFKTFNQLPLYVDDFFLRDLDVLTQKDALVIYNPPDALVFSPVLPKSRKSLNEHIEYIKNNDIKKAIVVANDIQFLAECSSLEYLWVLPAMGTTDFDYSPAYKLPNLKWLICDTRAGINEELVASVDYSQFRNLRRLSIHGGNEHHNVELADSVVSLLFNKHPHATDLQKSFPATSLRNFSICEAPITSLSGIESAKHLCRLDLSYNRKLTDISSLQYLCETLACLEIDVCGKIKDFSVLEKLHNLEYLTLLGSNTLPDLSFLKNMPKLKYLHLTMNVEDGDLSFCEQLPYVKIQNRKHYSHKNKDLPKKYSDPNVAYSLNEM